MRFDAVAFAGLRGRGDVGERRLAELFVPGLADLWRANLIPEPWTNRRPVRLVTARTILLAGMATAFEKRERALSLLESASPHVWHRDFGPLVSYLSRKADQTSLTVNRYHETDLRNESRIKCRNSCSAGKFSPLSVV
jgi:hypothetical protein